MPSLEGLRLQNPLTLKQYFVDIPTVLCSGCSFASSRYTIFFSPFVCQAFNGNVQWRKFPIDVLKYVFRDHHDQRYLLPLRTTLRLLLLIICCRAPSRLSPQTLQGWPTSVSSPNTSRRLRNDLPKQATMLTCYSCPSGASWTAPSINPIDLFRSSRLALC